MTRDPNIAYVFLRNSVFGPKGAAAVELCVRDLVRASRYAASTIVMCPRIEEPFSGVAVNWVPKVAIGGNLVKAWAVGVLLKRRGVDVAVVENHLPAAAFIAASSGLPVILHSHAYENAARGRMKRAERDMLLRRIAGLAFVSEDCLARFRALHPRAQAPMRAVPNGLDMADWSPGAEKDKVILSVGRALDDKGHLEAMTAIARVLRDRPDWRAGFILSAPEREPDTIRALKEAAAPFGERVRIETNRSYAEVKAAWEKAAVGMVLTKSPEPFGRTALEAMASGAALVTSALGGLAEICGSDALVVDPRDGEAVASSLAALVGSQALREKFARAGRARVEARFDMRAVAGKMDDFIAEIAEKGRTAQAGADSGG